MDQAENFDEEARRGGRLGSHSGLREAGRKPFLMIAAADLQGSPQDDHHAVLGGARLDQCFVPGQLFDDGKAEKISELGTRQ